MNCAEQRLSFLLLVRCCTVRQIQANRTTSTSSNVAMTYTSTDSCVSVIAVTCTGESSTLRLSFWAELPDTIWHR